MGEVSDNELSLLREIRDTAVRHQQYIEERDQKQNEYLAAESQRAQRFERLQHRGQLLWVFIAIALYLIAGAQFLR